MSTLSGPVVETSGLRKEYPTRRGTRVAVAGLDLAVEAGGVHGFLGPNGSGKSTTIRVLLGLLRADSGTVRLLGGDPWRQAADLHRRLAYVPGDVSLWPTLTGGECIDLTSSRSLFGHACSCGCGLSRLRRLVGLLCKCICMFDRLLPRLGEASDLLAHLGHRVAGGLEHAEPIFPVPALVAKPVVLAHLLGRARRRRFRLLDQFSVFDREAPIRVIPGLVAQRGAVVTHGGALCGLAEGRPNQTRGPVRAIPRLKVNNDVFVSLSPSFGG